MPESVLGVDLFKYSSRSSPELAIVNSVILKSASPNVVLFCPELSLCPCNDNGDIHFENSFLKNFNLIYEIDLSIREIAIK